MQLDLYHYWQSLYQLVENFFQHNFSLDMAHFSIGIAFFGFILSMRSLIVVLVHHHLHKSLDRVGYTYDTSFKQNLSGGLKKLFLIWGLWAFFKGITKNGTIDDFIFNTLKTFAIFYGCYVAFIFKDIINHLINHWTQLFDRGASFDLRSLWTSLYRALVIIVGVIMILETWKYDTTRLVASLGILGAAIALSAKQSLEDIFGSFTIYAVHAFKRGDHITIGKIVSGVVEHFGLRATRIRSDDGNLNYVPNKLVASAMITNKSECNTEEDHSFCFPVAIPIALSRKEITDFCRVIEHGLKTIKGLDNKLPPKVHLTEMSDSAMVGQVRLTIKKENAKMQHEIMQEALLTYHGLLQSQKIIAEDAAQKTNT